MEAHSVNLRSPPRDLSLSLRANLTCEEGEEALNASNHAAFAVSTFLEVTDKEVPKIRSHKSLTSSRYEGGELIKAGASRSEYKALCGEQLTKMHIVRGMQKFENTRIKEGRDGGGGGGDERARYSESIEVHGYKIPSM